jgi:nicotinate phosphoribosyltransferase
VDTYDTLAEGVPHALVIGREMQQRGETLRGVRLDSGDLSALAKTTRRMLDEAGLTETSIVASGDLDEYRIRDLRRQGAPIDMFGVGTRLVTGHGDEAFTGVYKLAAIADETGAWRAVHKKTDDPQKASLPGIKQVWRLSNHAGEPIGDWMESADGAPDLTAGLVAYDLTTGRETRLGAEVATVRPLLELVFQSGRRVADSPPLVQLRAQARQNVAALPVAFRRLDEPARYPLYFGPRLRELANP